MDNVKKEIKMDGIKTIDKLVERLLEAAPKHYISIAQSVDIPAVEFTKYAFWKNKGYTRNCIERTEDFELLLLCWNAGDGTPVHCHGDQQCWVYQVSGAMEEVLYKENTDGDIVRKAASEIEVGSVSYMDDSLGYHTLKNNTAERCMSLHLYAKPIDSCTYYDKIADAFIPKNMRYYSYKGKLLNIPAIKTPHRKGFTFG